MQRPAKIATRFTCCSNTSFASIAGRPAYQSNSGLRKMYSDVPPTSATRLITSGMLKPCQIARL
ncbi:hypothetical protein D3C76_1239000 [compost metagenome]